MLGEIDHDPAASHGTRHAAAPDAGAAYSLNTSAGWQGRIYLHPPEHDAERWSGRLLDEFKRGTVTSAIALVPALVNQERFGSLAAIAAGLGFWRGELHFNGLCDPAASQPVPGQVYAIVFLSREIKFQVFAEEFGDRVDLYTPFTF